MFFKTVKGKSVPTKAFYVVVGVCVTALCVYIGLRIVDNMRYTNLKKDVTAIGQQISTIAPTSKHKAVQYCKYSSLKYRQGNRTCHADYYALYDKASLDDARGVSDKVLTTINTKYKTRNILDRLSNKNEISNHSFDINNNSCYYQAFYYDELSYGPWTVGFFAPNEQVQGLVVLVTCSGPAMAEHYPLKD